MSKQIRVVSFILLILLSACSLVIGQSPEQSVQEKQQAGNAAAHVILISIDGLPGRYVTSPDRFDLKVPTLRQLKLNGAFAEGVESVYPSQTYPAHTSLVTGVPPAKHGIYMNVRFQDPASTAPDQWYWDSGDILVPALWNACRSAGLNVASVWWPVTKGAQADWVVPEYWQGNSFPPSLSELAQVSTPGLIEEYVKRTSGDIRSPMNDDVAAGIASFLIREKKPHLLLLHLAGFDKQSHEHGLDSKESRSALEAIDSLLARIVGSAQEAGIAGNTTFVIVSDHGFLPVQKVFNPYVALAQAKLVTVSGGKITDWKAALWRSSGSAAIVLRDPEDKPAAAAITRLFDRLLELADSPVRRVYTREELGKLNANPKAFLMFDAAAGYTIGSAVDGKMVTPAARTLAQHGYSPSLPGMLATLILNGRGVRAGSRVSYTRIVNVAPTVATLLGIDLSASEGTVVSELIDPSLVKPRPKTAPKKNKSR